MTEPNDKIELHLFPYQLTAIHLHEVHLKIRPFIDDAEKEHLPFRVEVHEKEEEQNKITETFDVLLVLEAGYPKQEKMLDIHIAIEGHFRALVNVDTIKPELIERFKKSDTILILWPYMRQMLQDFTNKMGVKVPLLPIIDARNLVLANQESTDSE